jgi:hypothetical protein
MEYIVATQTKASLLFKARLFSVIELKPTYTKVGISNTTRHTTANKQEEMPFKFILTLSFRRSTSLEILNSL